MKPSFYWTSTFRRFQQSGYRHYDGVPTGMNADIICGHLSALMDAFIEDTRTWRTTPENVAALEECHACFFDAAKEMQQLAPRHSDPRAPLQSLAWQLRAALQPSTHAPSPAHKTFADKARRFVEAEAATKTLQGDTLLFELCKMIGWGFHVQSWLKDVVSARTQSMQPVEHFRFCFELARSACNGGNPVMRDFALDRLKDHFFYLENYEPAKARRMLGNYLAYYDDGARPNPERSWSDMMRIGFRHAADVLKLYPPRDTCRDGVVLDTLRELRREMKDKKAWRRMLARASRDPS